MGPLIEIGIVILSLAGIMNGDIGDRLRNSE